MRVSGLVSHLSPHMAPAVLHFLRSGLQGDSYFKKRLVFIGQRSVRMSKINRIIKIDIRKKRNFSILKKELEL